MAVKDRSALGLIGEIGRLKTMTAVSLRKRFGELYPGSEPRSNNAPYLLKLIAKRLQQEPGMEKQETSVPTPSNRDRRLPAVGAIITKTFKGRQVQVLVTSDGFEFEGARYRSLSAIARKLLGGTSVNGFGFFGLLNREGK